MKMCGEGEGEAPSCTYKRMRGLCEPVVGLELMPARARRYWPWPSNLPWLFRSTGARSTLLIWLPSCEQTSSSKMARNFEDHTKKEEQSINKDTQEIAA